MFKHYVHYQIKCVTLHNTKNIGTGKNPKHVLGFLHYVAVGSILKQFAVLLHPELECVSTDRLPPVQAGGPSYPPQEEKGLAPIQANRNADRKL